MAERLRGFLHARDGEGGDPVRHHYYEAQSGDRQEPQIWAYTGAHAYSPGEVMALHVSTTCHAYRVTVRRDGTGCGTVWQSGEIRGAFHPAPADCSVTGCGWPVALEVPVGADWPSDGYLVVLEGAHARGPARHAHVVLIRAAEPAPLLLVACSGTWAAYNEWGGSNHYEGIIGPEGMDFSPVLSSQRPWTRGFAELPPDAPRIACDPAPPGEPPVYPHMRWAHATGHSKKYASAGWASYERPFLNWCGRQGLRIDVASQYDLQFRPELLDGYGAALIAGHDEYWSWEMRDRLDAWLDRGGRLARFAGNFYWQTRVEDQGRRQVCYKYRARAEDPLRGTERITTVWDSAQIGRPAALTMGLSGARGIYATWSGCVARSSGGFTVYRPGHWVFEGTGLGYGDVLGAAAKVFGYEVDGLDYEIRGGLPWPVDAKGVEILALSPATTVETSADPAPFIGLDDAAAVARELHGKVTPETLDKVARGAGMIAHYRRGKGEVLNAASCNWVAGLIAGDPLVERVTLNVLGRFAGAA
jgi:hypothetical protein